MGSKRILLYLFSKIKPFAEYGFNKSHAAAYALIAYQTAYLKYYHKEDFIAATMSTELSNTDKLREFVEELKRLDIQIIRPNVNISFADFKAKKNQIFYALGAIKNVGLEAVSNIVQERKNNGKFKSLNDFIKRVKPKNINKLQLEGLTKAGAFDELVKNRKALFMSIPQLIQKNKSFWEDKLSNQNNLFDDQEIKSDQAFNLGKYNEWKNSDKLLNEFQSVGFYISDHPLNAYQDFFKNLNIKCYRDFIHGKENTCVVGGTIMSIQEKKSIKGTPFAIIKFSDLKSEFELFLFSNLLIQNRDKLKTAESFILTLQKENVTNGNINNRINIKNLVNLNDYTQKNYEKVTIEVNGKTNFDELSKILKEQGNTQVDIKVVRNSKAYLFSLKKPRKFNFNTFNSIKNKEYVKNKFLIA